MPKKIAASKFCSALIDQDGNLYTWGSAKNGLLGNRLGNIIHSENLPRIVEKVYGLKFTDISVGNNHMGGITESGQIYTWGEITHNKLGHSFNEYKQKRSLRDMSPLGSKKSFVEEPTLLHSPEIHADPTDKPVQIVCRNDFSLVLTEKGKLYSFGYSKRGALGRDDPMKDSTEPGLVKNLESHKITKMKAGSDFILALNDRNEVLSWGLNDYGQLGHCADIYDENPTRI